MRYPRVQVAGIKDAAEAEMLLSAGVDDLGFPFGPGVKEVDATPQIIRRIAEKLPTDQYGVFITYLKEAKAIHGVCLELGLKKVQLHAELPLSEVKVLRALTPQLYIIKSLVVGSVPSLTLVNQVKDYSEFVDCFITDTFNPLSQSRGATGMIHDWDISALLIEKSSKPVILAGGLNPSNVAEAIRIARPAGVDAHTGLENATGRKDEGLVKEFVRVARETFQEISATTAVIPE